jgi:hypothetical protein
MINRWSWAGVIPTNENNEVEGKSWRFLNLWLNPSSIESIEEWTCFAWRVLELFYSLVNEILLSSHSLKAKKGFIPIIIFSLFQLFNRGNSKLKFISRSTSTLFTAILSRANYLLSKKIKTKSFEWWKKFMKSNWKIANLMVYIGNEATSTSAFLHDERSSSWLNTFPFKKWKDLRDERED